MRVTVFDVDGDSVVTHINPDPEMLVESHWQSEPPRRVRIHHIEDRGAIELQLVEIAAGGEFAMHSSPKLAFCQVVRGTGKLGLPGGRSIEYRDRGHVAGGRHRPRRPGRSSHDGMISACR